MANLEAFREKVRLYCRNAGYKQQVLALDMGIHPTVLSNKLNGKAKNAPFDHQEIKSIVRVLAHHLAITTEAQARELLAVMDVPIAVFSDAEWHSLKLEAASEVSAIRLIAAPSPAQPAFDNLPMPLTSFVGRATLVADIANLFTSSAARLVTLTGPGGVGKTRIGIETARALRGTFRDGACFVALAIISDPDLVPSIIAHTLGIREQPDQSIIASLKAGLRHKRMVLVLDNFEQLADAAPFVTDLLAATTELAILVTSRTALFVYGEREYPVPPLPVPDAGEVAVFDALQRNPAVTLFVQRAQAYAHAFTLTPPNSASVAAICDRLDGLPLAIEIAAMRCREFAPAVLRDHLDESFQRRLDTLSSPLRDVPDRQRALRNTIAWSYRLLPPTEQRLFDQLAVFTGGWQMQAVHAICADTGPDGGQTDVEIMLRDLTQHSLVRAIHEQSDSDPRFGMLTVIHDFALERLDHTGTLHAVRLRHALYYTELAQSTGADLRIHPDSANARQLEAEHANFRAALTWLLRQSDSAACETALRLVNGLRGFWHTHGYFTEGRSWTEKVLAGPVAEVAPDVLLKGLATAAVFAKIQGDYTAVTRLLTRSLDISRTLGDTRNEAVALGSLGETALFQADYVRAQALLEDSLRLYRVSGDTTWGAAAALTTLGLIALYRKDFVTAQRLFDEEITRREALQDWRGVALAHLNLACVLLYTQQYAESERLMQESVQVFVKTKDIFSQIETLEGIAALRTRQNRAAVAVRLFAATAHQRDNLQTPQTPADRDFYVPFMQECRRMLSQRVFDEMWQRGQALTLDDAVALAQTLPGR